MLSGRPYCHGTGSSFLRKSSAFPKKAAVIKTTVTPGYGARSKELRSELSEVKVLLHPWVGDEADPAIQACWHYQMNIK
jgi:hypothetical protein